MHTNAKYFLAFSAIPICQRPRSYSPEFGGIKSHASDARNRSYLSDRQNVASEAQDFYRSTPPNRSAQASV